MILVNNRDKIDWREGMTVQDVLGVMEYTFTHMTVTVNGELIPEEEYDTCKVTDNAEVTVFHLAHGG